MCSCDLPFGDSRPHPARVGCDHRVEIDCQPLIGWWVQSLSEPLSMQEQNITLREKHKGEKPRILHKSLHEIIAQNRYLHPKMAVLPLVTA
jgi:hypothetical protein